MSPFSCTGSPYYRLLEKYFVQEIIFRSFTYHCVVLLSSKSVCALFKRFYFPDNNTDLDVNVNERTKGEQHSDM